MLECTNPEFPWNPECGWYEACVNCRRVAWDHEQADPLQDVKNTIFRVNELQPGWMYPPAMLSVEEYSEKYLNNTPDEGKI